MLPQQKESVAGTMYPPTPLPPIANRVNVRELDQPTH